jgi:hypothetical protein
LPYNAERRGASRVPLSIVVLALKGRWPGCPERRHPQRHHCADAAAQQQAPPPDQIPALAIGIIEGLSFKGKCYSALAQILGTRSASERLAHLLLQLAEIYGQPTKNGIFIDAAFTHVDLAHIVGATRQWVTMTLKRLQSCGAIICSRGQIYVVDRTMLLAMETKESQWKITPLLKIECPVLFWHQTG